MKISLDWLSRYVTIDQTPEKLAETLTMAGLEVEGIERTGVIPDGVIVAKILSRKKHENSDHLSICEVNNGKEVLQIVCGAPNCDAGNVVPLAMIGTTFKDAEGEFTIKKGKIRGAESFGMMCSARELGLSADHDGLMILPQDWTLGAPLQQYIKTDTVYDCSLTPNRPDWLSHIGVARDVAALTGGELKFTSFELPEPEITTDYSAFVTVEAPELCPHYTARVIKGVTVGESPEWLKKALTAVGLRPINNIVDITNYVMMELGQPLHAFDKRFLQGEKILVRRAGNKETIVALDGKTYELNPEMLVIADAEKPVAIAGVMGGEHSGVLPDTTDIVLESAYFAPASIRATSRKLGLSSDSSYRYERGTDPAMVYAAGARAAQLVLELAGGKLASELIEAAQPMPDPKKIKVRFAKIRSLLGMDVSGKEMVHILSGLGFLPSELTADACTFTVPTWRAGDVVGEADLAEEVARIHGLDKVPDVSIKATKADFTKDAYAATESLRNAFISAGLYECVNTSMLDEKSALQDLRFESSDLIRMSNPISLDLAVMRPSLLGGMLATVRHNVARRNLDLALFEIGHVFCNNSAKFPEERDEILVALTGRRHPERYSKERSELLDFYDLKGIVESVLDVRRTKNFTFEATEAPGFVKGGCAELKIDGKRVGVLGEIVPQLTKGMRIQTPLYIGIFELDGFLTAKEKSTYYTALSQFPAVTRDVAFLAPLELENQKVLNFIRSAKLPNLENVELFDIFCDASLGEGRKSMAYTLVFRSLERTLRDDEVNAAHEELRRKLEKGLGVELR